MHIPMLMRCSCCVTLDTGLVTLDSGLVTLDFFLSNGVNLTSDVSYNASCAEVFQHMDIKC